MKLVVRLPSPLQVSSCYRQQYSKVASRARVAIHSPQQAPMGTLEPQADPAADAACFLATFSVGGQQWEIQCHAYICASTCEELGTGPA